MNRREAIGSLSMVTSHVLFPAILAGFIGGCKRTEENLFFFTDQELDIVKEVIDLIIPETKTSSASQVGTHLFLDEIFGKCLVEEQQKMIKDGLGAIKSKFENSINKSALLEKIDQGAFSGSEEFVWFILLKQYTLVGFFTSKEGTTKASNYVPVPGDYQGEIALTEETLNYGVTALRFYL